MRNREQSMLNRFSRSQLLLGEDSMKMLSEAKVAIFGIGGAGFLILKKKPSKKGTAEMEDDEEINFYDDDEGINEEEE